MKVMRGHLFYIEGGRGNRFKVFSYLHIFVCSRMLQLATVLRSGYLGALQVSRGRYVFRPFLSVNANPIRTNAASIPPRKKASTKWR